MSTKLTVKHLQSKSTKCTVCELFVTVVMYIVSHNTSSIHGTLNYSSTKHVLHHQNVCYSSHTPY